MTFLKKYIVLIISCLLILAVSGLVSIYSIGQSMALSPVIIGSDAGLSVNPPDASVFDIKGIYPGKTEMSQITIRNEGSSPFNLYITFTTSGDPVLANVLYVKISDPFRVYYNGLMSGTHLIDIGEITAGEARLLDLAVTMAAEAGNVTQNRTSTSSWVFRAVSPGSPVPGIVWTPDSPPADPLREEPPDSELADAMPGEQVVVIPPEEAQVQPDETSPTVEIPVLIKAPVEYKLETPPTGTFFNSWQLVLLLVVFALSLIAVFAGLMLLPGSFGRDILQSLAGSLLLLKGKLKS